MSPTLRHPKGPAQPQLLQRQTLQRSTRWGRRLRFSGLAALALPRVSGLARLPRPRIHGLAALPRQCRSGLAPHRTPLLAALLYRFCRLWMLCLLCLLPASPAWAGPVNWQELPPSPEGRQWWDSGSLRLSRGGNLSVLSRFQPASPDGEEQQRGPVGQLYVMEIDCGQKLYRDTSVNGIPRLRAEWQPAGSDQLIDAVIEAACAAGQDLLA